MRIPAWMVALILLVSSGYSIPYLLLSEAETWSGAFLFWAGFGIAVWTLLLVVVNRWDSTSDPGLRAE